MVSIAEMDFWRRMTESNKRIADALEKMAEALTEMTKASGEAVTVAHDNPFTLYAGTPRPAFEERPTLVTDLCGPCSESQGEEHLCWGNCGCVQHDLHLAAGRVTIEPCSSCGATPGTPAYDNFHDSQNCWRGK